MTTIMSSMSQYDWDGEEGCCTCSCEQWKTNQTMKVSMTMPNFMLPDAGSAEADQGDDGEGGGGAGDCADVEAHGLVAKSTTSMPTDMLMLIVTLEVHVTTTVGLTAMFFHQDADAIV